MKRWVYILLFLLASCEGTIGMWFDGDAISDARSNPGAPPPMDAASIAQGGELYALYCASCHGPDANGTATWPGSIRGYTPIRTIVSSGRGEMAPVAIEAHDTLLIQAYLLSLGLPDWSGLTGVELYDHGCQSCHGEEGIGSSRGPQLRFRDRPYFEYVTRSGGRANRFAAKMIGYDASRISEAQLDEMIDWLDSFPNATGGAGLFHQFCANCHGDASIRARTDEEVDEEGSILGVCRNGKEDSPRNREYMPGWSAAELSDDEIAAIQAYIDR